MPFLLILLAVQLAAAAPTRLFNGKDLSGWTAEGPRPDFAVEQEELVIRGTGNTPNWLRTEREYENFVLRFDYRLDQWAEAAVVLRAPRAGRPARAGLAVELAHDFHTMVDDYVTGGVNGAKSPDRTVPADFGKWHHVDIRAEANHLTVRIDQIAVQDLDFTGRPELPLRLKKGYIGFPDRGYRYRLRSIELEELPSASQFIDLDTSDRAQWTLRQGGTWTVEGGVVTGADGHGVLYAPQTFGDFELTALVRTHQYVNSGIFLHGSPDLKKSRGFEVQIYSPVDAVYPTGSVYGKDRSRIASTIENEWFLLQIRVEGAVCTVRVDGTTVSKWPSLTSEEQAPGQIGLQIHSDHGSVEFKDLRVRLLSADRVSPATASRK